MVVFQQQTRGEWMYMGAKYLLYDIRQSLHRDQDFYKRLISCNRP